MIDVTREMQSIKNVIGVIEGTYEPGKKFHKFFFKKKEIAKILSLKDKNLENNAVRINLPRVPGEPFAFFALYFL